MKKLEELLKKRNDANNMRLQAESLKEATTKQDDIEQKSSIMDKAVIGNKSKRISPFD